MAEVETPPTRLQNLLASLPTFVEQIFSEDDKLIESAIKQIRIMLSFEEAPPIQEIIDLGLVPRLLQLAQYGTPEAKYESAWALTNIASGTAEQTRVVVDNGVIPIFVELLNSPSMKLAEQVLWCLGNVAGDGVELRNMVMEGRTIDNILNILKKSHTRAMKRNIAWTLSNFSRGKPVAPKEQIYKYIGYVASCLDQGDEEVTIDSLWSFAFLTDNTDDGMINTIVTLGVIPKVITYLKEGIINKLLVPSLRTLGNILTASDQLTQQVIDHGIINEFKHLVKHTSKGIRKEAYWSISNIVSGTRAQVDLIIESDLLRDITKRAIREPEDVAKEMLWCIVNLTTISSKPIVDYLIDIGAIECLVLFLQDSEGLAELATEGAANILLYDTRFPELNIIDKFEEFSFTEVIMERGLEYRLTQFLPPTHKVILELKKYNDGFLTPEASFEYFGEPNEDNHTDDEDHSENEADIDFAQFSVNE